MNHLIGRDLPGGVRLLDYRESANCRHALVLMPEAEVATGSSPFAVFDYPPESFHAKRNSYYFETLGEATAEIERRLPAPPEEEAAPVLSRFIEQRRRSEIRTAVELDDRAALRGYVREGIERMSAAELGRLLLRETHEAMERPEGR